MWRLKPESGGVAKDELAQNLKSRLEALPQTIREIGHLEVGIDINRSERAADVVLVADFESAEQLAAYSRHPAHQEVVSYIREIVSETRVVDYEI